MTLYQAIQRVGSPAEIRAFEEIRDRANREAAYREQIKYNPLKRREHSLSWQLAGLFDFSKSGHFDLMNSLYNKLSAEGY